VKSRFGNNRFDRKSVICSAPGFLSILKSEEGIERRNNLV
jgi:hypothetical protein